MNIVNNEIKEHSQVLNSHFIRICDHTMKPFCNKQGFADLMVVTEAKRTEKAQRLASC